MQKIEQGKKSKFSQEKLFPKIYFPFNFESVFKSYRVEKILYDQIGLEFIAYHDKPVCCTLSRVAPFKKKWILTIITCFKRKIF